MGAVEEIAILKRKLADAERAIEFVKHWAWRANPKLSADERLSAIKYHPAIREDPP